MRQTQHAHLFFGVHDGFDLAQEPGLIQAGALDPLHAQSFAEGLGDHQQAIRGGLRQRRQHGLMARGLVFSLIETLDLDLVKTGQAGFQAAQGFLHAFGKAAAHGHGFADRLHGGGQRGFRAGIFLKREARDLGDHIINGRLKARRGRAAGDVVVDLIQRVADRQLGGDLGDGEARGLGRQRGRARHARVHLDDHHAAILGVHGELHVRAAGLHPDLAQHGDRGRAHALVFLVGQGQGGRDGDGIAGVNAHRVNVFDRADDDAVVRFVADHFHLVLFPAQNAFLDQHFCDRGVIEARSDDLAELFNIVGDAAAGAAHGEGGADHDRQAQFLKHDLGFRHGVHGARDGAFKTDGVHRHAEALAVFRLVDDVGLGADHLHIEQLQHAALVELQRAIERGLSAHGGQQRVWALLLDHLGDHFRRDRFDIGGVGQIRIGHDRGGV